MLRSPVSATVCNTFDEPKPTSLGLIGPDFLAATVCSESAMKYKDTDRYTRKDFTQDQLDLLARVRLDLGPTAPRTVGNSVEKWFKGNIERPDGQLYECAPAWIVKNRFIVREMSGHPGVAECVLDPNVMPGEPYPAVRPKT